MAGKIALVPLPKGLERTRLALHRMAEQLVAPARKPENEISLRATPGGFGTPVFEFEGARQQVRVEGAELVRSVDGKERRAPLGSLHEAGELLADLLPDGVDLDERPLEIDLDAAAALGGWYALGDAVLEELRSGARADDAPTEVSLWPEHFDIAIELGNEDEGRRANYGFSPGDENHAEPYLYVGPWSAEVSGALWNATGFNGAETGYRVLAEAEDAVVAAREFCLARKRALDEIEVST